MATLMIQSGKRVLAAQRIAYANFVKFKAAMNLQLLVRKFLVRRRTMKRMRFNEQVEKWEAEVEAREEQARVDRLVHKLEVEKWFIKVRTTQCLCCSGRVIYRRDCVCGYCWVPCYVEERRLR
jgi:hypothetical protein